LPNHNWSNGRFVEKLARQIDIETNSQFVVITICWMTFSTINDRKSCTPAFCDFTNKCHIDGKNHSTVTDLNHINFVDLFYSFIFQQLLIKICLFFPNYTLNYQNPFLCIYCAKQGQFFGWVKKSKNYYSFFTECTFYCLPNPPYLWG